MEDLLIIVNCSMQPFPPVGGGYINGTFPVGKPGINKLTSIFIKLVKGKTKRVK
jgi:hypothetical protein